MNEEKKRPEQETKAPAQIDITTGEPTAPTAEEPILTEESPAADRCADPRQKTTDGADGGTAVMTNGDFIRSMSDADIRENFTQLLCEFVQRKQTSRCRSREHCFHCIKDWLKEESVALRRADDDTE
mgnify:CR=1 FL=1